MIPELHDDPAEHVVQTEADASEYVPDGQMVCCPLLQEYPLVQARQVD
jgi:hypothetical protein